MGKNKTFKKKDYLSSDGMLTSVWGPSMWHYLHTMSFNYPVNPTQQEKKHYKDFILASKSAANNGSMTSSKAIPDVISSSLYRVKLIL